VINLDKIKKIIINLLIPLSVGIISAIFSDISSNIDTFIKPSFTPPDILFPIVWTILYVLMGISSYLIMNDKSTYKNDAIRIYGINLFINGIWSIIFFKYKLFLLATILIIILIVLTIIMIYRYYQLNKVAGIIQIPYLVWLILAVILSASVMLLN